MTQKRMDHRDERGTVLILAVVGVVIAMIAAALAVDLGRLAVDKRNDQKIADLAALDAARDLSTPAVACSRAQVSAARNGYPGLGCGDVKLGYIDPVDNQFHPGGAMDNVQVNVRSSFSPAFPFVSGPSSTGGKAIGRRGAAIATVRVGSSLATVSTTQSLLLDKTVSALVGGSVSLTAVGWQGVASGHVTFDALAQQLAIVTGNSTFNVGTASQVLQATFTAKQLFTATANVLRNDGTAADVAIANSVDTIGTAANGTSLSQSVRLYDLFDFGSVVIGDKRDVANANLNVFDLIKGAAVVADGDHFASFNLTAGDIVGTVIPGGFSSVKVNLGLIEAPRQSFPGPAGVDGSGNYYTQASTSQIRVRLDVTLAIPLTSAISILGVGSISLINVTVPFYLELGNAHAYLETISCSANTTPTSVVIRGTTDAGTAKIGFVSDASLSNGAGTPTPVTGVLGTALAGLVTVSTTGSLATTSIAGNPGIDLTFTPPYADSSPSQPVPGTTISLPSLATGNVTASVAGIVNAGLISDVISGVNASGLTFSSTLPGVDSTIVKPLFDALGLSFASADVWAPPVATCAALSPQAAAVSGTTPPVLAG